ncbi:Helicase (SNF2-related protein) [Propionibacterium freudenreichii]|nr:Helicase (SNF2-related protein) [Propionibacterium freudenreichii]
MNARSRTPDITRQWLRGLSEGILRAHYGQDLIDQASALSEGARVVTNLVADGGRIKADVADSSSGQTHEFHPEIQLIGYPVRIATWSDRCDCGNPNPCVHATALMLTAKADATEVVATQAPVQHGHEKAAWETALSPALPRFDSDGERELALQFEQVEGVAGFGADSRWRISALRAGPDGEWQRAHMSWHDINHPGITLAARADQLNALRGLERLATQGGRRAGDILLERMPPELWRVLRRAANTGVTFLHKLGDNAWAPVTVDDHPATLGLDIVAAPHSASASRPAGTSKLSGKNADDTTDTKDPSDFELRTILREGDTVEPFRSGWLLLGNPPHGLLRTEPRGALRLTPLADNVDASLRPLLEDSTALKLPAEDLPRFLGLYAPFLRDRMDLVSTDGSAEPDQQPTAGCWVRADFSTAGELTLDIGIYLSSDGQVAELTPDEAKRVRLDRDTMALYSELRDMAGGPGHSVLTGRDMLDFVSNYLDTLQADERVRVDIVGKRPSFEELTGTADVRLTVTDRDAEGHEEDADADASDDVSSAAEESQERPATDWFDLDIDVRIGDEPVPARELLAALVAGQDYLILDSGSWLALDRRELDPLRALVQEASTMVEPGAGTVGISRWQLGLWEELATSGIATIESARWRRRVQALLDVGTAPTPPVPAGVHAELRPYQVEGYGWLSALWDAGLGGILADDMGLGKTLQTLCLVERLHEDSRPRNPSLVIAPTSVMGAWTGEAKKFVPGLNVVMIDETSRKSGVPLAEAIKDADLVVTSYTLTRLDAKQFQALDWSMLVLDEAQFIKNREAKTYAVIRELRAHLRLAITGTPLENSLMDLWSLLSITAPGVFPDPKAFTERYVKPVETGTGPGRVDELKRRIRPLMLRRTKHEVAAELPPKQEFILPVTLGREHRRIYDRQLQAERMNTLGLLGDARHHRIEILAALTRLRQLSLAPGLVDEKMLNIGSAKIDTLVEHLRALAGENHRALVFSQFTSFLHLVRDRLTTEGIEWEYLDGRTRHRDERVQRFKDGNATAFLISLKAGGFGLTLTEADYVYVLDPWWNPAAENQAIDRTHRIGQDKQVMVYRMVSTNTIEEKVVALQQRKRDLFDQVVGDQALASGAISVDDIRALLA